MDYADIERIAHSVCREFGLSCTSSVSRDPSDPHRWRVEIRRDDRPKEVCLVSLYCTAATSPVLIRESLKRQLALE